MDLYGIACEGVDAAIPANAFETDKPVDCIIVGEGWGNTGYYGADALEAAAAAGIFAENTRSFLGHPPDGVEEPADKTVGYLAGPGRFIASDPEWGGKATIRAPYIAFSDKRAWISERAKVGSVALSLRAPIMYRMGKAEGREGRIVTKFAAPAWSVDVVARPGAGGKFGLFKESALPGSDNTKEQEGSEMPLSKEEIGDIATATAIAAAEAMKPLMEGINSALGAIKTATEAAAPQALPISGVVKKITEAKLTDGARDRVLQAVESAEAGKATDSFVDDLIAKEAAVYAEALESVKAGVKGGTISFEEGGDNQEGKAEESSVPKGWAVEVKD